MCEVHCIKSVRSRHSERMKWDGHVLRLGGRGRPRQVFFLLEFIAREPQIPP